jgi:hypothetical protein
MIACEADRAGAEAERVAFRRRVLDWRDHWSAQAETRLTGLCRDRAAGIGTWAASLPTLQLAAARLGRVECPILAETMADANGESAAIEADARHALTDIVVSHLQIEARAGRDGKASGLNGRDWAAIGKGVGPLVAAGALLASLPTLATTTTVGMFGLIVTSSVSVPVLAAGAAGVGALGYFGVLKVGDLRSGQERRLVESIEAVIETRLLAHDRSVTPPSLLLQLQDGLALTATDVLKELT